ncbi:MAG: BON domain-containing protein [Deltaproteobacteria bacterium]|nr:BON domain-containing protein [Deltaproteobacteria bacterium]
MIDSRKCYDPQVFEHFPRKPMKNLLAFSAAALGCFLLALYAAQTRRDSIQEDLWLRTKNALASIPIRNLVISADGREITLRGQVTSERAKRDANLVANHTYGVHTVTNLLEVARANAAIVPPPAAPPTSAATECQEEFNAALRNQQIQFEPSWYAIQPASLPLLDGLVEVARKCPSVKIEISGHTDPIGVLEANIALSKNRAQEVANYLIVKGIPADRLVVVGHGPNKPIADNATPEGMKKNRRIDFNVISR